jgi:DNA-binding transcriptional MerR regulator
MPLPHSLRTSDLARAGGVHPNTIRLYEAWGFLPPVPRTASGYRIFSQAHQGCRIKVNLNPQGVLHAFD